MNHIHPIIITSIFLICLAAMPAAAQIPFEISGYVQFSDGSACLDPTVTITNLNTGDIIPLMTLPSSNYYQAKPAPLQNEINVGDVLEFRASCGTDSAVIEHRISASGLNSGALYLDITLGTTKTATGSGAGDPPLPQAPTTSPRTVTPTSTSTPISTFPDETHTPGFEIVSALAIMITYLVLGRRL